MGKKKSKDKSNGEAEPEVISKEVEGDKGKEKNKD